MRKLNDHVEHAYEPLFDFRLHHAQYPEYGANFWIVSIAALLDGRQNAFVPLHESFKKTNRIGEHMQ